MTTAAETAAVSAAEIATKRIGSSRQSSAEQKGSALKRSPLVLSEHHFVLAGGYVGRAWPFFALSDLELYLLAFIKIRIPAHLDFRVMNEQILAAVFGADKSKTFCPVKPLHNTFTHKISFWPSIWP
jgi:hypothetical protein